MSVRLRDLVDKGRVRALMMGRPASVLAEGPDTDGLFATTRDGIISEVAQITGDPPRAQVADLAAWAVCLGIAYSVEASLFPEQQLGEDARASELRIRYLSALSQLRGTSSLAGGGDIAGSFSMAGPGRRALDTPR